MKRDERSHQHCPKCDQNRVSAIKKRTKRAGEKDAKGKYYCNACGHLWEHYNFKAKVILEW